MANSSLIPGLRYRDAPAMIEWLVRVFGFEKHLVVPNADGTIAHAELTFGGGMLMLGSAEKHGGEFDQLMAQPDELGGRETQCAYVLVPDADAVLARALAGGAAVLIPIQDQHFGGRAFTCRDPGGHIWCVGTHDPWRRP